jgi:chorismate dehydratase
MKIALVSYLNTTPYLLGLESSFTAEEATLMPMPPAECAKALSSGEANVALIPVGALPEAGKVTLLEDHCIGANDRVDSVFLFSACPIDQITTLVQDSHSRTSNALAAILLKHWWNRQVQVLPPDADSLGKVQGTVAAVGIGDKAWAVRDKFPYVYDLAAEWRSFTGLPMVFAVWACRTSSVDADQMARLDAALHLGRTRLDEAARRYAERFGHSAASALDYLTRSIDFRFTADRHEALDRYLALLQTVELPLG